MDEIRYLARPALLITLTKLDDGVLKVLERYGSPYVLGERRVVLRDPKADSSTVISELVSRGIGVEELRKEEKSLEEFFFSLVRKAEGGQL